MAISPEVAISSVRPSGAALATRLAAIMPAAPVRFSTITGEPRASLNGSTRSRAEMSMPPPAGKPAMMRMVRSDCAEALPAKSAVPALASTVRRVSILFSRMSLAFLRAALADRRQEREPRIPGKIDPGVLRHLGDKSVDHRAALRLRIDCGEMRAGQKLARDLCGLAGIDQVVDDQHTLAAQFDDVGRDRLDQPQLALPGV